MNNIKHWLDITDQHRDEMALGLLSDPGLSKTAQIEQWAEEHGRKVVRFITSQRMPSEISGMPMPVNDTRRMEVFDYDTLLELEEGDVLFFDEFTNGNIQTLNACLTLIQDRQMISGKKLPSILVVAAGNPQGSCDLLPQTKQRFLWRTVEFNPVAWSDYIYRKYGSKPGYSLVDSVRKQYQEKFDLVKYNYMTARTADLLISIACTIPVTDIFWNKTSDIVYSSVLQDIYQIASNYKNKDYCHQIAANLIKAEEDGLDHELVEVIIGQSLDVMVQRIMRYSGQHPDQAEFLLGSLKDVDVPEETLRELFSEEQIENAEQVEDLPKWVDSE